MKLNGKMTLCYIGGASRSGSTLLGRLMGELEGMIYCGELRNGWMGFVNDHLCSCGIPLRQCTFWNSVMETAYGNMNQLVGKEAFEIMKLQERVAVLRRFPWVISPLKSFLVRTDIQRYIEFMEHLYYGIRVTSGQQIIVDTSKTPGQLAPMTYSSKFNIYLIHLIRDSRAVAFSWQRKKADPVKVKQEKYMPQYGPFYSTLSWVQRNALIAALKYRVKGYMIIRYEDLIKNPQKALNSIADKIGKNISSSELVSNGCFKPKWLHTVAGNPMRFENNCVKLRLDNEWKEKMKQRDKNIATVFSLPWLVKYRYI